MTNQLENLTKEEYEVAVEELRRESAKEMARNRVRAILYAGTSTAIEYVGLAETKSIIREINRTLREMEGDGCEMPF